MLSGAGQQDDDLYLGDITAAPVPSLKGSKERSNSIGMKELTRRNPSDDKGVADDLNDAEVAVDEQQHVKAPLHAWIGLAVAIVSVSSAGFMLKYIDEPPITKAAWRLQATTLVLLPAFIWDFRRSDIETQTQSTRRGAILLLASSGILLGLHFGSWIWSLDETSLAHSLLFVQAHPLIYVTSTLLLYKLGFLKENNLSKWEITAAFMGFGGLGITQLDVSDDGGEDGDAVKASWRGDMLSLFASGCMLGYLLVGKKLRKWMPLFIYAFPVNFFAMLLLTIVAAIAEDKGAAVLFGWFSKDAFWLVMYQAIVPGFFGHVGLNRSLRHLDAIVISIALNVEPLIGTFMGWAAGEEDAPGVWTAVGGLLMIGACITVTAYSMRKK